MDKVEEKNESKAGETLVQHWIKELDQAREREKTYRKEANEVIGVYEGEKAETIPFNICFSNTETLAPALYNSPPRSVVERRFKDDDPLAKAAGELCQRALAYFIDTDLDSVETFDDQIQSAVLSALVPGRGVTRFKYDATFSKTEVEATEENPEPEEVETLEGEMVCGESVAWDRFLHGFAKRWKDVPWVSFEHDMTREELVANFGDFGERVELVKLEDSGDSEKPLFGSRKEDSKGVPLGKVYEIWHKEKREILFISPGYPEGPLKRLSDKLNLTGFFPMPKPLQLLKRVDSMTPLTLYSFYKEQAKELNRITIRINKLIVALKVRGLYDSTVEGIDKVLSADDNTMIPAENVAALQQGQSLEKAFFLLPIEKLIAVLQQLYTQRMQVKQVIYEITGIADIMRGSTQASETLGAQEIKNQWGTLRLKRAQKEVMRYVRDCLRIVAEITSTKLAPQTLKAMTGVQYPLAAEKQQAQMQVQQLQQQQMAMQQPMQPGMLAPPPQQPQIPPQLQQMLSLPTVEELKALLSDDIQRSYRIDIETNSTIDAEATEDKKDISELMNAIAQFLNGVAPAVEQGILPFEAAKAMLLGAVRRYRFGSDVEDMIKSMQPPQPKPTEPPDPTKSPEYLQAQAQSGMQAEQMKQETMRLDMEAKRQEHQLKMEELRLKGIIAMKQHDAKMQQLMMPKPAGITKP
jgi:hypothetical protein